jgi:hypothetical protein
LRRADHSSKESYQSIYIKANLAGFVCVLVGDGRCCYVAGAFSLASVLGHNNGVAFLWGPFRGPVGGQMWRFPWGPYFRNASYLEELRLLNSDQQNLWRVKLQAGQQLRVSKFCESEMATKDTKEAKARHGLQHHIRRRNKGQEREAAHSPPSSIKVKNGGAISPLPHTPSWCGA